MKSANPDDQGKGGQRKSAADHKQDFDNNVQNRVDRERRVQSLKEHRDRRNALLAEGQSDPMKYMRALMSSPTMFPVNTTAVPVVDLDDATIEDMTDDDLASLPEEELNSTELVVTPETELKINNTIESQAYWMSLIGLLKGLDSVVDEFCDATSREERENSEMSDRAIELLDRIKSKIANLNN
ncbi:hypothetical protein ACQ4M3_39525 [Leptolyngbya sp. AN03gr2]|uniref:hypothetical protein n=1 Tax=unclassified Leptolyngbya TaxID=2650499 RepID=UPI003D321C3B